MIVRNLKSSDIPILNAYSAATGFEYPDLGDPNIEKILVVVDENDQPIVAVAAKKLVELFAWINPEAGAALRIEAIDLLHIFMAEALKRLGYECVEAFIPAKMARRGFGRVLAKRYGWYKNWVSWGKRLI